MRVNKWTVGLAAAGLVSLPWITQAEEKALSPVMSAVSSTTISSYVDTSAHWNMGTGNANPAPYIYNKGKADGFNLNVVDLTIEKALSEETWGAGYRMDLWFGPNADVFGTTSELGGDSSDFAIKQAYVLLRAPIEKGLDFKLGVFNAIIGYESHDAVYDANYTRSYAVSLEPHTHTGLLATYHLLDWVDLNAGIANTVGPRINQKAWEGYRRAESSKTYMGSIDITAPDSWGFLAGSKITAGAVTGFDTASPIVENRDNYYVGAKLNTPVQHLTIGGSYDFVHHLAVGATDNDSARAYALYSSYQMEKWGLHLRGEYAEAFAQTSPLATSLTRADVLALTGTLSYDLWKNVLTRVELRWDHAADGVNGGKLFGGTTTGVPERKNEYLLAANVIYKF